MASSCDSTNAGARHARRNCFGVCIDVASGP
jgi:hypothetical protein